MKKQASQPQNPQSGSIFVWLFIMIALFGALSYAMIQSSRQGASSVDSERGKLIATEILSYHNQIRDAIKAMRINGCKDTEISFQSPLWTNSGWYDNTSSPADKHCHVFDPAGGGLTLIAPPDPIAFSDPTYYLGKYSFSGGTVWDGNGTTCTADTCAELVMYVNSIPKETCVAINRMAGIEGIPYDDTWGGDPFAGTYDDQWGLADDNPVAKAKTFGCFEDSNPIYKTPYSFGAILIAR